MEQKKVNVTSKNGENHSILNKIRDKIKPKDYQQLSWSGTFEEYLHLIKNNPGILRNAFQRLYDMIMLAGYDEYVGN